MKCNKQLKYSNYVAFSHFHGTAVNNSGLVFEYIETFYNTVRIHSHCGYLSPNEYENVYEQKLSKMEKLAG